MSNLATLTRSHKIIAAKKRAKRQEIQQVIFDEDARCNFLTGFHKRKLAKAEAARKRAQEREKQARLEARREQRRALREQAIENAKRVEDAYASIYGATTTLSHLSCTCSYVEKKIPTGQGHKDEDKCSSISSSPSNSVNQRDEEYEDEQVLATVTVVEDFDPDTILHDPPKLPPPPADSPSHHSSRSRTSATPAPLFKNSKSQKVRYQTKEARKVDRRHQLTRRTEKAKRIGGKRIHKNPSKKKKGGSKS